MRQKFLESVWSKEPYPPAQLSLIQGRVVEIRDGRISVLKNGEIRDFCFENHLTLAPGFYPKDCLRPGDIIEFAENDDQDVSRIKLLVPSSGEAALKLPPFFNRPHQWAAFCKKVREFFEKKDFLEIRTPSLVVSPGLEPFLDPFSTLFNFGKTSQDVFLPTSPEFHLKKALVMGYEKCFEFKECFRNGEVSQTHYPEFLMLEWYRAFSSLENIISDVSSLFFHLEIKEIPQLVKMEDLWSEILDFKLTPRTSTEDLLKFGYAQNDFDDLFNLIFLEKIEPVLKSRKEPTIVWHYPPSQSALARLTQDGWADRFEVYWKGLELANAFHELNDPREQRLRFKKDQEKKKSLQKPIVPVDEEFLKALEWGMPPSSGIALGMERLFMAIYDVRSIRDVRLFSFLGSGI